jgi:hypothetical protein
MSVSETLATLRTKILTVNPAPQPAPLNVFADPAEAVNVGEFPAVILALAPEVDHEWQQATAGGASLGEHDYEVMIYILVGARSEGLPALHSKVLPWPKALADVLIADITLGGTVSFIGDAERARLFRYRIGQIAWADGIYFGLKVWLKVQEMHSQTVG